MLMKKKSCIQHGFTLPELIAVIVILGILAATAAPRFFDKGGFDSRGFYDQTKATLRYAQKAAIAKRRFVCVAFTANNMTLTYGATSLCADGNLISPTGDDPYVVNAPANVTLSGYANFNFNALGRPSVAQNIAISGYATPVIIEAETGYVQ